MKRFTFPLESLRVLRRQKERMAQRRYAKALTVCDDAAIKLRDAVVELNAGWDTLVQELGNGATAKKITDLRAWCAVLEICRNERKAALDNARQKAEMVFQEMISAAREREALERFYEKSRLAYERERQRAEQKNFDELAIQLNRAPSLFPLTNHKNN